MTEAIVMEISDAILRAKDTKEVEEFKKCIGDICDGMKETIEILQAKRTNFEMAQEYDIMQMQTIQKQISYITPVYHTMLRLYNQAETKERKLR